MGLSVNEKMAIKLTECNWIISRSPSDLVTIKRLLSYTCLDTLDEKVDLTYSQIREWQILKTNKVF